MFLAGRAVVDSSMVYQGAQTEGTTADGMERVIDKLSVRGSGIGGVYLDKRLG